MARLRVGHMTRALTPRETLTTGWGNLVRLLRRRGYTVGPLEADACLDLMAPALDQTQRRKGAAPVVVLDLTADIPVGARAEAAEEVRRSTVCVVAVLGGAFNVDAWRVVEKECEDRGREHVLIFTDSEPTTSATREIRATETLRVEVFHVVTDLSIDKPAHAYAAPTRLVTTRAQYDDIVKRYGDTAKFPRMLVSDPIARHYGFSVGDLLVIQRAFPGLPTETIVRRVVAAPT